MLENRTHGSEGGEGGVLTPIYPVIEINLWIYRGVLVKVSFYRDLLTAIVARALHSPLSFSEPSGWRKLKSELFRGHIWGDRHKTSPPWPSERPPRHQIALVTDA